MNKLEEAYNIIDEIDQGTDYNAILLLCVLYFPELNWEVRRERTLKQMLLDEIINQE